MASEALRPIAPAVDAEPLEGLERAPAARSDGAEHAEHASYGHAPSDRFEPSPRGEFGGEPDEERHEAFEHADHDDDEEMLLRAKAPIVRAKALVVLLVVLCLGMFSVSQWWAWLPEEAVEPFCVFGVDRSIASNGTTNGIDRRRMSRPTQRFQVPPKEYCEEVYRSSLGRAMPDCDTGQLLAESRDQTKGPWWKRWGSSTDEAVEYLVANLKPTEKEGLVRGFGWHQWNNLPGHYIGNTFAVPRLGVPSINMQDASSGFRTTISSIVGTVTQWPSMLAASASWDYDIVFQLAAAIGREFRMKGANVILGPGVNVQRVASNGRNAEYISGEEPALGARLAAAYVRGVQSQGVAAVVKHYALNNQETNRDSTDVHVDERTLWEVYYPPFEAAVGAGAASLMCSYNRVGGKHSCSSEKMMLHDTEQFGLKGWVMSDWWAAHGIQDVSAGLDQIMPGNDDFLPENVDLTGEIESLSKGSGEHILDRMTRNILRGMISSSAWDEPLCTAGCDCQPFIENVNATSAEHRQLARVVAAESAVLLKNEGQVLPIDRATKTIGLVGSSCSEVQKIGASDWWQSGNYYGMGGSARVIAEHALSLKQALERRRVKLVLSPTDSVADAIALAQGERGAVDVLITCAGGTTSEAVDRRSLELDQHHFIHSFSSSLAASPSPTPPLVVLAFAPGQFVADWKVNVSAALVMFLTGEETASAAADLLLGDVTPSGKLPITLPLREADMVAPCRGKDIKCVYSEGLNVGWRALHSSDVAFPFGHGLSYTKFEYSWASPTSVAIRPSEHQNFASFVVKVTNVGTMPGAEVVQLYFHFPESAGEPALVLRAFQKTSVLMPGESANVVLSITGRDLSIWGEHGWKGWTGLYDVAIGSSSRDARLSGTIHALFV